MARKPRLHIPGGVYHVMLRGNGGQDIFFADEDRYRFYLLLQHVGWTEPAKSNVLNKHYRLI